MTPGAIAGFRGFFRLVDIRTSTDPVGLFAALLSVAKWSVQERVAPGSTNDRVLDETSNFTQVYMGLLFWLATIDRDFFNLSKRMAARTLVRHERVAEIYRQMAAALLVAGEGPKLRKTTLARDVVLVLAVEVGKEAGWLPTESAGAVAERSGCAKAAAALGMEYSAVEKIWRKREERLVAAGFEPEDVSDFFGRICPMK